MAARKDKHGDGSPPPDATDEESGIGARLEAPRFGGVALVCRECEKRGDGPTGLKSAPVRKRFKYELHRAPVRLRILQCSCMRLCPKKAIAAALVVAGGGPACAAEIRDEREAEAVARAFARRLESG